DVRMGLTEQYGCPDPLVGLARGHADVRDHYVRTFDLDRGEQRIEIAADCGDLDVWLGGEQPRDPLADEVVVFCEHHASRHRSQAYDRIQADLDTSPQLREHSHEGKPGTENRRELR